MYSKLILSNTKNKLIVLFGFKLIISISQFIYIQNTHTHTHKRTGVAIATVNNPRAPRDAWRAYIIERLHLTVCPHSAISKN